MKQLRTIIVSMLAGALLATAGTTFGAEAYKKISATLRPDLAVKVDGEKVKLQNAPLTYNGTTYVPLREAGQILGATVGYNAGTITIDSKEASKVNETTTETGWITLQELSKHVDSITLGGNDLALTIKKGNTTIEVEQFKRPAQGSEVSFQVTGGGELRAKFLQYETQLSVEDLTNLGVSF